MDVRVREMIIHSCLNYDYEVIISSKEIVEEGGFLGAVDKDRWIGELHLEA